ncbi:transposase, MuDR, MULE transposase domain protein [Tanacetum coccineum]
MASNIKNFKCLIHFNGTQRGSILSEDLTYSMLHEMVMQKFKLEANDVINLSFKLSSFDFAVDITDDDEIHTFLICLRPVLMIDAAHLKGLYKGTNLVAVTIDGNNQIVPIEFGICKGETGPCWSWWMSVLKECIGDNPNLLFISDRHAAIALAVEKEFPLAFHVVCCRHLVMNLGLKNKKRKGLFWKICKAYTQEDYATNMNTLQIVQPDAREKAFKYDVLSFKLSSFDSVVDITDDAEVQFFVECACNSDDEFAHLSNEYNTDDVVTENPQDKIYKWQKFMSFEPDIPETPVYKAKQNISNQYSQQSEVEKGKIFDNKESLIMAVRLKALSEGFQFVTDRSAPERCYLK